MGILGVIVGVIIGVAACLLSFYVFNMRLKS